MPQDAFTLIHAAKELNELLSGGKVNKIIQPAADEVFILFYTGKNVNIAVSANAQTARICPTDRQVKAPAVAPNFCMLLRKHLSGATVKSVENVGFERITVITFEGKNDFFEPTEKKLVCEIMGKYSNVILTENGKILGTLKPSFGDIDSGRMLLTGLDYKYPPAQDKIEITDLTRVKEAFSDFPEVDGGYYTQAEIKGLSSQTATEAASAFMDKYSLSSILGKGNEYADFLYDFLLTPSFQPNVTLSGREDFFLFDYKTIGGEKKYFDTLLQAEKYYFDKTENEKDFRLRYKTLKEKIRQQEKKLLKKKNLTEEKILSCSDAETNKKKGEILTAYQYVVPASSTVCELPDFYSETGEKIKITLDGTLSANRNAQNYFKKYQKQKKTLAAAEPQLEQALSELNYISDLYEELDRCETAADFDALKEEIRSAGYLHEQRRTDKKEKPSTPKTFEKDGFLILAGRNNLQNDKLTGGANKHDMWLHTKDFHSSHVIIETNGKPVPDDVLLFAAEICAYNSKARGGDKVPVDYCLKKFVKKPPKSAPGKVIYTDFKTILVTPRSHE